MQDAINFTQNINLDWLWVDSLCIFQDSKEDWNREALTMRQVYQGAFLVVTALGAASSDEGLFALRDPLLYSACFLFETEQGEDIYGGQASNIGILLDDWPLHQRGWVMQERILASRTLNFGPYLIWQCKEKLADEYNIIARSGYKRGFNLNERFSDLVLSAGTYNMSSTDRDETILDIWGDIALEYTSGILTVPTDRLIAISGVVSAIQRRTGWTNLAGLWEPFLWKQVLWEKAYYAVPQSRKPTGLQPSWSWTAITGGVMWSHVDDPEEGFFLNAVAHVQHTVDVSPSQMDMTDSSGPRAALQVSCKPARIGTLSSPDGLGECRADLIDFPLPGEGVFEPDLFEMTRPPELFLPIAAGCWNDEQLEVYGLAVSSSTSCAGAFERVGFFTFKAKMENDGGNSPDYDYAILHDLSMREDIILI
jgi:hypothetical protein